MNRDSTGESQVMLLSAKRNYEIEGKIHERRCVKEFFL